jgi:hypothetical protein
MQRGSLSGMGWYIFQIAIITGVGGYIATQMKVADIHNPYLPGFAGLLVAALATGYLNMLRDWLLRRRGKREQHSAALAEGSDGMADATAANDKTNVEAPRLPDPLSAAILEVALQRRQQRLAGPQDAPR